MNKHNYIIYRWKQLTKQALSIELAADCDQEDQNTPQIARLTHFRDARKLLLSLLGF